MAPTANTAARREPEEARATVDPAAITELIQRECSRKRCIHCGQMTWLPWYVYRTMDRVRYVKSTCRACGQPGTSKVVLPANLAVTLEDQDDE